MNWFLIALTLSTGNAATSENLAKFTSQADCIAAAPAMSAAHAGKTLVCFTTAAPKKEKAK